MSSTALGAEKAREIILISDAHEKFYYEKLKEVRYQDVYHKALVYCLGISDDTRRNIYSIYDFKTGCVKTECLHEGWQTSGSVRVVRMAFNLYCNGTPSVFEYDDAEEQVDECRRYTVEEGVLPIYPTRQGIYYWKDESIWSIGINEQSEDEIYQIKRCLKQKENSLEYSEKELDKYVAVFMILIAVDRYKGGKGTIYFDKIKYYVEILNKAIYEALDIQQISDMNTLKEIITSDTLYREMYFHVNEVNSTKERQYSGYKKDEKSYSFGNIKYHEELDKVFIYTYDDCVELTCEKEGKSYKQKLDMRRRYASEGKILAALDCWRCAYLN